MYASTLGFALYKSDDENDDDNDDDDDVSRMFENILWAVGSLSLSLST